MRLTARGRAGHGSMINRENAVTVAGRGGRPDRRATSGRCGSRPRCRRCWPSVGELAGTEATPENAEALVEEFGGAARMIGAVIRNTCNPTMLGAGYKVNVIPTEATAHVDGRFLPGLRGRVLRDPGRAGRRGHRDRATSATSSRGRRRTTATWSTP